MSFEVEIEPQIMKDHKAIKRPTMSALITVLYVYCHEGADWWRGKLPLVTRHWLTKTIVWRGRQRNLRFQLNAIQSQQ